MPHLRDALWVHLGGGGDGRDGRQDESAHGHVVYGRGEVEIGVVRVNLVEGTLDSPFVSTVDCATFARRGKFLSITYLNSEPGAVLY